MSRNVSRCSSSGRLERVGRLRQHLRGDVVDVAARVAVLGGGLAFGRGDQRAGEAVDLGAVVVEVVLAHHVGALRGQQPAQRVADGGPAGAADVDRPGRVGRDELEVDLLAGQLRRSGRSPWPASMTLLTITPWAEASRRRLTKPGPATSAEAMPSASAQRGGQPAGQLARVGADLLAQLKGQVGGVVAVLGVARPLDGHRRGSAAGSRSCSASTAAAVLLSSSARSAGVTRVHPMV